MTNNETLIPIPGRLHSVATEGHVAGADEIIDDTLQKDQATINKEVNEAIGEGGIVDEKIAAAIEDAAFIDNTESSSAIVPSFDPESQTVHITAQTLSEQQKAQVRANIGLDDVDAKINEKVASEASQRTEAVSGVQASVNAETSRAQGAESTLQNDITTEVTRAQEAETELGSRVTTNESNIEALQEAYRAITQSQPIPKTSEEWAAMTSWEEGVVYRVQGTTSYADYMYNGTTTIKMAEYDNAIDSEPTAGSDNLVKSGGVQEELALGAVYDVSAKNPTGGSNNDGKWESLSALLSDTNLNTLIPTTVRKGGMSIKFVQSSDNNYIHKYVQYRYMGTAVTGSPNPFLNTDNWSFCGDDILIDNPEFIEVKTDKDEKILEGRKKDGTRFENVGLEVNGNTSLKGKVAIDNHETIIPAENTEWLDVVTDKDDKIVAGIKKDGSFWWGKGIPEHLMEILNKFANSVLTNAEKSFLEDATMKYPESFYRPILKSLNRTEISNRTGLPNQNYKTLTLGVLTDIHARPQIDNFVKFTTQYASNLNDSIILGDIANSRWREYNTDWDSIPGYDNILKVIGNHDVYDGNNDAPSSDYWKPEYYASEAQCRQRYMQGIENWGVTGPSSVAYYYKDYADTNIRLIVIDSLHWNTAQKEWFSWVLNGEDNPNSALALDKHVIVASHIPAGTQRSDFGFFDCNFSGKDSDDSMNAWWEDWDWRERVDSFQNDGGVFVCYMYGHVHQDWVGNYTDYPNQTFVIFPTGADTRYWTDTIYSEGTDWEDQFTIFSVDAKLKYIRLYRVGSNISRDMVHREFILISYEDNNRKIVSQN